MSNGHADLYQRITDRIVAALENGVRPWQKPWSGEHAAGRITRPLRHNGIPYQGINVVLLWMTADERGYTSPLWVTFQQALEMGAHVRKGEKGSPVVYANTIKKTEINDKGEDEEHKIPFLKQYTVFNAEQVEGLPEHFYAQPTQPLDSINRIEHADCFFAATKADIRHEGSIAAYNAGEDYIKMPPFPFFRDAESYAATLAHELTHWTKHPTRLGRDLGRKKFGDEGYAREELVAELGSAFLCADLGITPEIREDHAGYIENWLTVLKNDKRAIFSAASHAQRAAEYLHSLQPAPDPEPDHDVRDEALLSVFNGAAAEPPAPLPGAPPARPGVWVQPLML